MIDITLLRAHAVATPAHLGRQLLLDAADELERSRKDVAPTEPTGAQADDEAVAETIAMLRNWPSFYSQDRTRWYRDDSVPEKELCDAATLIESLQRDLEAAKVKAHETAEMRDYLQAAHIKAHAHIDEQEAELESLRAQLASAAKDAANDAAKLRELTKMWGLRAPIAFYPGRSSELAHAINRCREDLLQAFPALSSDAAANKEREL